VRSRLALVIADAPIRCPRHPFVRRGCRVSVALLEWAAGRRAHPCRVHVAGTRQRV